jgi:hypothetical protein
MLAAALALAFGFVRALGACLDVTPIVVPPREAGAITEGQPCLRCVQKPSEENGCADGIAACVADPRCNQVYECMVDDACLDHPIIDDKITCTLPCTAEAGIVSFSNDHAVDLLLQVVQCGQERCAAACNLGDAGLDLDAL